MIVLYGIGIVSLSVVLATILHCTASWLGERSVDWEIELMRWGNRVDAMGKPEEVNGTP